MWWNREALTLCRLAESTKENRNIPGAQVHQTSPQCVPKLTETTPEPLAWGSPFQSCPHPALQTDSAISSLLYPPVPVTQSSTAWLSTYPSKTSSNRASPRKIFLAPGKLALTSWYTGAIILITCCTPGVWGFGQSSLEPLYPLKSLWLRDVPLHGTCMAGRRPPWGCLALFTPSSGEQLNGQDQVHALAKSYRTTGKDIGTNSEHVMG